MPIYHVHFTCAKDYMDRRLPFRPAHLKQLAGLREDGRVVAGGPEPDGTAASIFYRVGGLSELECILADNEFNRAGLFTGSRPRQFAEFLEPIELPPVVPVSPRPSWRGRCLTVLSGVGCDRIQRLLIV
jgi:uncharacterized protein YciI